MSTDCIPVSSADTRRHLRSANRHLLAVPCFPLNTYGRRAFSVAGPMAWIQRAAQTVLGVYLKRTCSRVTGALGFLTIMRYTNRRTHSSLNGTGRNEQLYNAKHCEAGRYTTSSEAF